MFAVPGWNVSAPLKTQTEVAKPTPEGKKSKKRKRKNQDFKANEENISEVLSGNVHPKKAKGTGANNIEVGERAAGVANDGDSEKPSKKRKRKGDKSQKEADQAGEEAEVNGIETPAKSQVDDENVAADKPAGEDKATSKREKKKRKRDQKNAEAGDSTTQAPTSTTAKSKTVEKNAIPAAPPSLPAPSKTLTPLQQTMRAKLASARFRHLNEALYTKPSQASLSIFAENPDMFDDYHRGFAQQVEVWPENPVDGYVSRIRTRGKAKDKKKKDKRSRQQAYSAVNTDQPDTGIKPLPRDFKGNCTIADLGCGTASLAQRLQPNLQSLHMTIHSFDLSKPAGPNAPLVTIADISALPLPDSSVDVTIFCLALMGTNWLEFIDEAYRILRWKGELWIAEIKSRFGRVARSRKPPINSVGSLRKPDKKEKSKKKKTDGAVEEGVQGSEDEAELAQQVDGVQGKDGTDVSAFVEVLQKRGFVLDGEQSAAVDLSNKMFVKMQFVKGANPAKGKNVKKAESGDRAGGIRMGLKGKKFTTVAAEDEDEGDEKDGKVLKPCLYKIR
ncbi:methyltransferase-domain-containing protein [Clohesyomyces aquaticus]|uniref:Ribosomal RNA-processing protein 8 n=1 Tax=Clohesyomyces aquaticus TaxID=1231657 RepID=A0A1Y1YJI6_9PLEO|nr:methyltransferase-domain-containing protein [Clohesyomyces aquaticus]